MVSDRLRDVLLLPVTIIRWWQRTTTTSRREQVVVLGGLPAVLVVLWMIPTGGKLGFSLAVDSVVESPQTVVTAFTANYVHVSGRHLMDNLLNFWVTLFALYPLVAIADWGRQFRLSAVVYLLGGPFVIAWLTLLTLGALTNQSSVGFSGITAAFLGLLPVVLAAAANEVTDGAVDTVWALIPFVGSLAVVFAVPSVPYGPVSPLLSGGLLLSGIALIGVFWYRHRQPPRPGRLRAYSRQLAPDVRLAFLIGSTVFVFGVAGALVFVRTGTNIWGHLAGYLVGFTVPYVTFVLFERLG